MNAVDPSVVLELKRNFVAPPASVFDAWFEREQWQRWIGPAGTVSEVPLLESHLGGRYRIIMRMSDGRVMPVSGEFRTVRRPEELSFTWGWEGQEQTTLVVLTFRATSGGTEMTLRHEGLLTVQNCDAHGVGWAGALTKLESYLAAITV